jgi:UDP-glucose 4-epimerase
VSLSLSGGRVVVTGGAGFIGAHLVESLLVRGAAVTVIDDLSTGSLANLDSCLADIDFVEGDICDPNVAAVVSDAEMVLHLAVRNVRASIRDPRDNFRVNADGTLELLEAMRRGGQGRFVYVSSSEIYGTAVAGEFSETTLPAPTTVYGAGKLAGELITQAYFRTYGMDTVVIRPFNNYGPRSHFEGDSGEVIPKFILRALAGRPLLVHGDGAQTRDFMYVEDTADWLCELATSDDLRGGVFNIGYGREVAVNELARLVLDMTGAGAPVQHVAPRPGDLPRLLADVTLIRKHSEFTPRVGFEEGLERTVAYFRDLGDPADLLEQERAENWT